MSAGWAVRSEEAAACSDGWEVRVLPSSRVVGVDGGESLMAAAQRHGLRWPSMCGGEASCSTCFVRIEQGLSSVAGAADRDEQETLERIYAAYPDVDRDAIRLACRLRVCGSDLIVRRTGVRPAGVKNGFHAKPETQAREVHE